MFCLVQLHIHARTSTVVELNRIEVKGWINNIIRWTMLYLMIHAQIQANIYPLKRYPNENILYRDVTMHRHH